MTVLGCDKQVYKKRLFIYFLLIAVVSVAVIALNILLAVFRTDATHIAFLIINIISDIVAVWYLLAAVTVGIIPKKKLLKLYERGEKSGKENKLNIIEISNKTIVVQGFKCCTVTVDGEGVEAEIYLIKGAIQLEKGQVYKLGLVEGIIYYAEEVK